MVEEVTRGILMTREPVTVTERGANIAVWNGRESASVVLIPTQPTGPSRRADINIEKIKIFRIRNGEECQKHHIKVFIFLCLKPSNSSRNAKKRLPFPDF